MTKLVHMMLRVLEEKRSVQFYSEALGLRVVERLVFDDFTLVYMAESCSSTNASTNHHCFELELTINHGRTEPYTLGDGYGHLAVSVDDLEKEHVRLQAAGHSITPIKTLDHNGKRVGQFFFLTDPDGYRIEILQRGASGRF